MSGIQEDFKDNFQRNCSKGTDLVLPSKHYLNDETKVSIEAMAK